MNPQIKESFDKMEGMRQAIQIDLVELNDEQLNKAPAEGKWSILQILHHLIEAEGKSVAYISKKMKYVESEKNSGLSEAIRSAVLDLALKLPIKFKAPAITAELPEHSSLDGTREEYDKVRHEMQHILEEVPEELIAKRIFKHPIAGKMNLYQAMSFMENHFKRHMLQIRKIETSFRQNQ